MEKYVKFHNSHTEKDDDDDSTNVDFQSGGEDLPNQTLDAREMQPSGDMTEISLYLDGQSNSNGSQVKQDMNISTPATVVRFVDPAGDRYSSETKKEVVCTWILRLFDQLWFRLLTLLLILLDVVLVILDLCDVGNRRVSELFSLIILSFFMIEVTARIFSKMKEFFHNWIEVIDAVIVTVSLAMAIASLILGAGSTANYIRLLVAGRLIRIVLLVRLITERKQLQQATRHAVSQNKRRYQKDGFDLDLCYVTDKVIAMSFPSSGLMAFYRNPIKEVARFLEFKHKDHYRVYNLCSEKMYDESMFSNNVERIRVDDHNVPKLHEMVAFVENVHSWLNTDNSNVIAVHCKGGKGRTGTLICTWLVATGHFDDAKASLEYFGTRRTDSSVGSKFQGVETPSQSRYVGYYEFLKTMHNGGLPPERKLKLTSVTVEQTQGLGNCNGRSLWFQVFTPDKVFVYYFGLETNCTVEQTKKDGKSCITANLADSPAVTNDVKIMFHTTNKGRDRL